MGEPHMPTLRTHDNCMFVPTLGQLKILLVSKTLRSMLTSYTNAIPMEAPLSSITEQQLQALVASLPREIVLGVITQEQLNLIHPFLQNIYATYEQVDWYHDYFEKDFREFLYQKLCHYTPGEVQTLINTASYLNVPHLQEALPKALAYSLIYSSDDTEPIQDQSLVNVPSSILSNLGFLLFRISQA